MPADDQPCGGRRTGETLSATMSVSGLLKLPHRVWKKILGATITASLRRRGVGIGGGVRFHSRPLVDLFPGSRIAIGERCVLCSDSRNTALGVRGPVILRTLSERASIRIAEDVGLSGTVICATRSVSIGAGTLLGADVMIFDTDFHPVDHPARRYAATDLSASAPVTIGNNAVIGAGSVVSGTVLPNTIYAGVPARLIRRLSLQGEGAR
jgi:acetyltransferase-like isoleucine patch superfamily enzyme